MRAFTAAALLTPLEVVERPLLLVSDDGRIVEASSRDACAVPPSASLTDFGDAVLAPGYFDIHIHGGAGFDVMESSPDALPAIEGLLAKHGVTAYFPTTVTAPMDVTLQALERLADAVEAHAKSLLHGEGARPLGIHLEGPFLSHAKKGVHPPDLLLDPTPQLFERFWQASRGHIRMMTIAPELPGAIEVIALAAARGVCVSLGHSNASTAETHRGMAAGGHHCTHAFNAMRPLDHRELGILGTLLTSDSLTADIIADGVHVHPEVVQMFLQLKGEARAVLITDATAATGMPDGTYKLGRFDMQLRDGVCWHDGHLAGSALTMDLAVRNVMLFAGWSLRQAVRLASANPADVVGEGGQRGRLVPGAIADFVVLSPSGEVRSTYLAGRDGGESLRFF